MRRRRHKLEISTFPFLAVLLGAMGSLIFLLLVMDRRAKIVARNKAREAIVARQSAATEAERLRAEDWERQRRQLHDMLAAQDQQLRGQLQQTLTSVEQSGQLLQARKTGQDELQGRIEAEQRRLMQDRDDLRQRQAVLMQSNQLADASKAELVRLTRDLLELEHTLTALKQLKSQQRPTYSLVPYRGQRGGHRMPIYVECTRAGLAFLPDGERLGGTELDLPLIRSEVERRRGPLVKARKLNPFQPDPEADQPYVLFLVRPDGIGSYYRGQAALRGYQIDYGYELVDADWTLETPAHPGARPLAQIPPAPRASAPIRPTLISGPASAGGNPGGAAGSAILGTPGAVQEITPGQPLVAARSPGKSPGVSLGSPEDASGSGSPGSAAGSIGRPNGGTSTGINIGFGPRTPAPTSAGAPSNPEGSPGKPGGPSSIAFRPAQGKGASGSVLDGPAPGLNVPGSVAKGAGQASSGAGGQPQPTPPSQGAVAGGNPPPQGAAMNRLAVPSLGEEQQRKPGPAPLGRVIGNRDFIITIACYAEGAALTPGGASFQWKGQGDAETDEALVRAVVELVRRRQATVRPGEPPYRAVLRFEVHEQGRRNYHHVFPLLQNLRLPMVREDVEES